MGTFYGSDAGKAALQTVSAALQSGAVKLLGPTHQDDAETFAKADALYLATVMNELAAKLKAEDK